MADAISVFISYSHSDMDFVDRLEANLRARGFVTWVDRRRLEGTVEWQPQIDKAIDAFPMMIVVLSQGALESEYVRYEYERGHKLGKRIVTVRCEEFYLQQPPEFSGIQFVDFMGKSGASYENALRVLIDGCQNPPPHQNTDSRLLYQQAHDLEGPDAERAASVYQRLLIRDPQYASGEAQRDFERLNQRLYPQRVRRLREQAELAHQRGAYGAEAGALRALIDLGDQDRATFEWAREYLRIAEENSQQMDLYDYIQKLVKRGASGDLADARSKLETLWTQARFFRDPAGVAPTLGLGHKVPITYERWKEELLAGETKAGREEQAKRDRGEAIARARQERNDATSRAEHERNGAKARADEDSRKKIRQIEADWSEAQSLMRGDLSATSPEDVARRLGSLDALPSGSIALERIRDLTQTWRQRQNAANVVVSAQGEVDKAEGTRRGYLFYYLFVVAPLGACSIFAICITASNWFDDVTVSSSVQSSLIAGSTIIAIIAPVLLVLAIIAVRWRKSHDRHILTSAQQDAEESTNMAQRLYKVWLRDAEPLYQNRLRDVETLRKQRLQQISEQSQRAISGAERHYQQTMTEIEAEHARTLAKIETEHARTFAEIEARYPN